MYKKIALILGLSALASPVLAGEAHAKSSRHNANTCTSPDNQWVTANGSVMGPVWVGGWSWESPWSNPEPVRMYCALHDANDYAATEIEKVNVHVRHSGSTSMPIQARACASIPHTFGAFCSPWVATPNYAGNYVLRPSLGALSVFPGSYGYLVVELSNYAEMMGFYTRDTP